MTEYIERDALRQAVLESQHDNSHPRGWAHIAHDCEHAHFVAMIARFPAADVAPVVRCKDCKWFADNNGGEWYGCQMFQVVRITPEDAPKPDDFCSYGEQKDGGASNA